MVEIDDRDTGDAGATGSSGGSGGTVRSGPSPTRLPPVARRRRLVEVMRSGHAAATVGELARELGVSTVTIHRDLDVLERDGQIRRVHGGAQLAGDPARQSFTVDWLDRIDHQPTAKAAIALEARALIRPGSTIFLDASTSCLALAAAIEYDPLPVTVVTTSPLLAFSLYAPDVHIVVVPGHVDQRLRAITGRWTTEFLAQLNLSTAFVSGAGVSLDRGVTTTRPEILDVCRTAMDQADESFVLADSGKFGRSAMLTLGALDEMSGLITDADLAPDTKAELRGAGIRLLQPGARSTRRARELLRTSTTWALAGGRPELWRGDAS